MSEVNNDVSEDGNSEDPAYPAVLAGRIKEGVEACLRRGMSRDAISTAMGYRGGGTLSKWETGKQSPGPENLAKLALATGLSLDWIVAERGPMFALDGSEGYRLEVIGAIADGTLDDRAVKALAGLSQKEAEDLAAAIHRLQGWTDGDKPDRAATGSTSE